MVGGSVAEPQPCTIRVAMTNQYAVSYTIARLSTETRMQHSTQIAFL